MHSIWSHLVTLVSLLFFNNLIFKVECVCRHDSLSGVRSISVLLIDIDNCIVNGNFCSFWQVFHEHPLMADYCSGLFISNDTASNSTGYPENRASVWNGSEIYSSNDVESLVINESYRDFRYVNINFIYQNDKRSFLLNATISHSM